MKKLFTIAFAAIIGFASCAKDNVAPGGPVDTKYATITANAPTSATTKISIDTDLDLGEDVVTWKAGDQIKIYEVVYDETNLWWALASTAPPSFFYTVSGGLGTKIATFTANSGNKAIFDKSKKYVAFHAGNIGLIGASASMIKFNQFQATATPLAIDYVGNKEWAEQYIIITAQVEFDAEGNVLPLTFQNNVNSMFEFQLSTDGLVPDFTLGSIQIAAGTNLVADYYSFYYNNDFSFNAKAVQARPTITYTFKNLPIITKTPTNIRIPIFIRTTGNEGARNVTFTVTSTTSIPFTISKSKGTATTTIFPAGKTYVIPIVVNENITYTAVSRATWTGWAKTIQGPSYPVANAINGTAISSFWHSSEDIASMPQWYMVDMKDATSFDRLFISRASASSNPDLMDVEYYITDQAPVMTENGTTLTQADIKAFVEATPLVSGSTYNSYWTNIGKTTLGNASSGILNIKYDLAATATSRFILIWMPTSARTSATQARVKIADFQIYKK